MCTRGGCDGAPSLVGAVRWGVSYIGGVTSPCDRRSRDRDDAALHDDAIDSLHRSRDIVPPMSNGGGWFYRAMHREPVVMWSCMIGALGLALPLVVPRDAFAGEPAVVRAPPSAAAVVRALKPQRGAGDEA